MSFGEKLFELRKQKGLSQEGLAMDLRVSQSSISNYELEISKPDISFLEKVSQYFEIPVIELLKSDSQNFFNYKNKPVKNIPAVNLTEKLIEQYEETIRSLKEQIAVLNLLLEEK